MPISWFEPKGTTFIRVISDVVEIKRNSVKFILENNIYQLTSVYNINNFLFDDILYMVRFGDELFPIRNSPIFSESLLIKDFPILSSKQRQNLWKSKHEELQKELEIVKQTLSDLLKQRAQIDSELFQSFKDGFDFDKNYNALLKGTYEYINNLKEKSRDIPVLSSESDILDEENQQQIIQNLLFGENTDDSSEKINIIDESKIQQTYSREQTELIKEINLLDKKNQERIQDLFE